MNVPRLIRAAVLTAWSTFFAWLAISGEATRYLGPRTQWVIVFGALALGLGALGHLATLRTQPRAASMSDVLGGLVMVLPMVVLVAVPSPQLGAQAASRRSTSAGIAAFVPAPQPGGEVGFREIHFASRSPDFAAAAGIGAGTEVTLTGFVTHREGRLELTRFYVSCCAADAIPYSVPVTGEDRDLADDTWVRAAGELVDAGGSLALQVESLERIAVPDEPYLS